MRIEQSGGLLMRLAGGLFLATGLACELGLPAVPMPLELGMGVGWVALAGVTTGCEGGRH